MDERKERKGRKMDERMADFLVSRRARLAEDLLFGSAPREGRKLDERMPDFLVTRRARPEEDLLFGSTSVAPLAIDSVGGETTCEWADWADLEYGKDWLNQLVALVEEYRLPRFYVQSMFSPLLREIQRVAALRNVLLEGIAIIEAPILGWGDLPPGIYKCGKDFYLIDRSNQQAQSLGLRPKV